MKYDKPIPNPYRTEYEISKRVDLFKAVCDMADGFYTLLGHSDEWWEFCSFSTFESELIKHEWDKIDWDMFSDVISKIQMIMMGAYCDPKRFLQGLEQMKADGCGVYNLDKIH